MSPRTTPRSTRASAPENHSAATASSSFARACSGPAGSPPASASASVPALASFWLPVHGHQLGSRVVVTARVCLPGRVPGARGWQKPVRIRCAARGGGRGARPARGPPGPGQRQPPEPRLPTPHHVQAVRLLALLLARRTLLALALFSCLASGARSSSGRLQLHLLRSLLPHDVCAGGVRRRPAAVSGAGEQWRSSQASATCLGSAAQTLLSAPRGEQHEMARP